MKKTVNLIVIGVGPHSKRIYLPALMQLRTTCPLNISLVIDLKQEAAGVQQYLTAKDYRLPALFVDPFKEVLPADLRLTLDTFVQENDIDGVIIATEPSVHRAYALWALEAGLHILMDKPITTRQNVISDAVQAHGILTDYQELLHAYQALQTERSTIFSVNVQRRYHPGFQQVLSLIREVAGMTNCPVTAIQSTHCDGQWRLPSEMVSQDYHPYNQGYGKLSHSGYHIFDMVSQFCQAPQLPAKAPDAMQVISSMVQPRGFIKQLPEQDYTHYFRDDYETVKVYNDETLFGLFENYGEIDAAILVRLLKEEENIANITINLLHNSFARRNWIRPGIDLYKGNGRVKHEYHNIQQGPFQNIQIHSYQAKDKHTDNNETDYLPGGNNHFDIYVFRNIGILGGTQPLEIITMKDLANRHGIDNSKLLTEQAKGTVVKEFLDFITGAIGLKDLRSNIDSHLQGVQLMSAAYLSHIHQQQALHPIIDIRHDRPQQTCTAALQADYNG
ncbi:Gfo/Idh/MocA family protein [Chitinophaga nivalis]|uniref:Gfo/Idh/MocA family oxidoreductase n=1 Tax=Chitinophaga nivalis TaxID=2991709 RepID=A0ABT3IQV1_9BACT|nr:Gfo/Idh/MocA family oxidoreductase [Chitinophaga nivalis]MCW3463987.1 Gfo/Idh/MocA family oxidoreductase [Chitinophaga nivalis]MCW3486323.1 Gfo/Idh/MocA family oxidoreductase [Chitinophaga nivalis]